MQQRRWRRADAGTAAAASAAAACMHAQPMHELHNCAAWLTPAGNGAYLKCADLCKRNVLCLSVVECLSDLQVHECTDPESQAMEQAAPLMCRSFAGLGTTRPTTLSLSLRSRSTHMRMCLSI